MYADASISQGWQEARTRWGTHASGAEFDRKKRAFLSEEARDFVARQVMCVVVGPGPEHEPRALLLTGQPGFVEMPDSYTCFIPIERRYEASLLLQGMRAVLAGGSLPRLALCFLQHTTRQRICVQGEVEILPAQSSDFLWLCMHVKQAFFHCPKYIRTRVSGLHMSIGAQQLRSSGQEYDRLDEDTRAFLARQVLCYLCTIDREGQCAVNHRGGAPGFLVTLEPDRLTPGGVVLLPDYSGNGAFEAIGNILETSKATLLVPGYAEQLALSITGDAAVLEPGQLPGFLRERCRGAMRIVALTVRHVERQDGDWSEALAYEHSRAKVLDDVKELARSCQV